MPSRFIKDALTRLSDQKCCLNHRKYHEENFSNQNIWLLAEIPQGIVMSVGVGPSLLRIWN